MKCKKCAGNLPYGTYGKVKCEYCNTINNVPTPEQEREKKVEVREASGRKWVTAAVVIVMLGIVGSVAAFVPLISVTEYYTDEEIRMKTVSYQEKEPYNVQESYTVKEPYTAIETYTEKEPYTDIETTYKEVAYEDEVCSWVYPTTSVDYGGWHSNYYQGTDLIITNAENQAVTMTVTFYWFDDSVWPYSPDYSWDKDDKERNSISKDSQYVILKPLETKTVTFTSSVKTSDGTGLWGWFSRDTNNIEECKTVTKFRDVPETQTVTKYRDVEKTRGVTKYRAVTKYRDVTKYRTVTKTKKVPEQVQVSKTRPVKKTLLDYLMAQPLW